MSEPFKIDREAEAASIDRGVAALVPDRAVAILLFRNARRLAKRKRDPNWVFAMSLYGCGSTYAWAICERIGVDPDSTSPSPRLAAVRSEHPRAASPSNTQET